MRVYATGGSGRLGRYVLSELSEHGHDVVNVDRSPPRGPQSDTTMFGEADLSKPGQIRTASAIERSAFGFQAFKVTASDRLCTDPTNRLIDRFLPNAELHCPIEGTSSGFALDKSAHLLGWQPRFS